MKKNIILFSFLFILFAGYTNAYEFPDKIIIDKDFTVAKIGDDEVKMSEIAVSANRLNKFLKDNFVNSPEWRLNYIKEIIIRKSLEKYAIQHGFDKNEDVKFQIENAKTQILSNAVLSREISDKFNITEKDKEKYYEENKSKFVESGRQKSYTEVKQQVDTEAEKNIKDKIISLLLEKIGAELSVTINETEIKKDLSGTQKK